MRAVTRIYGVAYPGEASPSVARALSSDEIEQLVATALTLPSDWLLFFTPPHGQLAIAPRAEARVSYRCWYADPVACRIRRGSFKP